MLQSMLPPELPRGLLIRVAFGLAVAGAYFGKSGGLFGSLFGFFFPLVVAAGFFVSEIRARDKATQKRSADFKKGQIEVLTLSEAAPLLVYGMHPSVEPAFAFELTGGQTLLLVGPWLRDPRTYDGPQAQKPRSDGRAYANGLPPPYAFPVDAFEVHRFPLSGTVTRIWLHGEYLAPRPLGGAVPLLSLSGFQSTLLETSDKDLRAALDARAE